MKHFSKKAKINPEDSTPLGENLAFDRGMRYSDYVVKPMNSGDVINRVEKALRKAKREFRRNPASFFTESDIRCLVVRKLQDRLKGYTLSVNNIQLPLVHNEYPTPFRCDMSRGRFRAKPDRSKSRRGHFDIAILNPRIARRIGDLRIIRGQNFNEEFIRARNLMKKRRTPFLLYAIELMVTRSKSNVEKKIKEIMQDFRKAKAAVDTGFAMKAVSLTFETADTGESMDTIIEKLQRKLRPDLSEHARCEFVPYKGRVKTLT